MKYLYILLFTFLLLGVFFVLPTSAQASDRYWVSGGNGNWSSSTNWSTTSGGSSGAAAPTSTDAAIFDAASGSGTATVDGSSSAASLDMTNFTGTLAGGSQNLRIANSQVAGNVTFGASMTITFTGSFFFNHTSGTATLTTNAKTLTFNVTVNAPGGTTSLADDVTMSTTAGLSLLGGTFVTNNHSISTGFWSQSNNTARTITLGSSAITLTNTGGNPIISNTTTTNETMTANTATFTITAAGAQTISPGDFNWNGASLVFNVSSTITYTLNNSPTFANLTLNSNPIYSFTAGVTWTITGTVTTSGTSISSRLKVTSATRGTSFTISAATWNNSNADFEDMVGAGAGTFDTSATVGDLGGNSGTFAGRTPTTYYWIGNGGNYSDTAHWSASSGGSTASTIPLPQDTARFDSNSISSSSQSVVFDTSRIGSFDFTGVTNTPNLNKSIASTTYGSITVIQNMTMTNNNNALTISGRGTTTIATNGINSNVWRAGLVIDSISGTLNQQSDMRIIANGSAITLTSGTFNTNNYNISFGSESIAFFTNSTTTRTINLGSSTITFESTLNSIPWRIDSATNLTFNAGTSTISINQTVTSEFRGGGLTYNNVVINGTATLTFSGSNTFRSLTGSASARTIKFTAGTTQTITSKNGFINGSSGAVQTLQSTSSGSPWYLTVSQPYVQSSDYLSLQDSVAGQNRIWYAGANSTNVSGNVNWNFTTPGYSVNSPTAYWKLDDATGTSAKSSGSISNTGTLSGSTLPTWQTEDMCLSGKCLYFDGSTSYIRPANTNTAVSTGTTYTMQGWFKTKSTPGASGGTIYSEGNSGSSGNHVFLRLLTGCKVDFVANDGTTSIDVTTTDATTFCDGRWHLFTVTRSSSTIAIYVDGLNRVAVGTYTINAPTINIATIGALGRTSQTAFFPGFIDEVKTYNYARTQAQVLADFTARSTIEGVSLEADGALNNNPNALNNNLVGYWKMNESSWNGTSGEVVDSSGNSNNGTGAGGITTAGGKFGNGGSYDGSDDSISVPDVSMLRLSTGAYSSFAWVNTSSPSTVQSVIRKGSLTFVLALVSSGKVFCQVGQTSINTGTAVSANTWAHIGCTYDGTTLTSYLNGVSQGSTTVSPADDVGSSVHLGSFNGTSQFFVGKIDEVRLYNRFLTPNQVSQLYNFAPGPVGYWNFEEGSGTSVADRSTNANTGTLTNGPTFTTGKVGKAVNFDGSNDYIEVNSSNSLNASFLITLSTWVKPTSTTNGNQMILIYTNGVNEGVQFFLNPNTGNVGVNYVTTGGSSNSITAGVGAITANQWSYLTTTYDGSTAKIYVNGVLKSSSSFSNLTLQTSYNLRMAKGVGNIYQGYIDEAKIYNYARSDSQVVEDMNGGHPAPGGSITAQSSNFGMSGSPVGYWKFNEGQGTTANNSGSVGSTINGTLTNMASPATSTSGWTQSGKFGKGLAFDGTDDYVSIPDNASLNITGNLSVSAWVYLNNTVNRRVLSKGSDSSANYGFQSSCNGDGKMCFNVNNGGTLKQVISQNAATTGVWTHWVGVYDGANISLYMNGMLQNKTAVTGVLTTNSGIFTIGTQTNLGGFINASIDEVKIYNFALTADQVKQDMNRGANEVLGAAGDNSTYQSQAANQEYCVPGDSTACTAPVGEWKFEEGSGTSAKDTSGNENTGTLTNGPTYATGKVGKAISFDGSNDYIQIADSTSLKPTNLTISTWVKLDVALASQPNAFPIVIDKYTLGTNTGYRLLFDRSADRLRFGIFNGSAESAAQIVGSTLGTGWHHIEGTYDGTSVKLYVDGVLNVSASAATSISYGTETFYIGSFDGSSNFIQGKVDQVRIFNYARSASQIAWDYNRGAPAAMYKLDECTGSTTNDSSGNSYTGTLTVGSSGTQTSAGTCVAVNTATAWYNGRTGKFNSSLNFDGTDDFITTSAFSPLATAAQTTTKLSWGGWFYPTSSAASKTLMEKATEFQLTTNSSSQPLCGIYYSGAFHNSTAPSETLTLSSWNHVMCVYDGTNINTYLNGVLIKQSSETNSVTAASSILYTAESSSAGSRYSGQIDSERIYSYALTASQIKAVMAQDSAVRFGPSTGVP